MCSVLRVTRILIACCIPCMTIGTLHAEDESVAPLAVLRISDKILTDLVDFEVSRDTDVRDDFQGTLVVGKALTVGHPKIKLDANEDAATFKIVFAGTTNSRTQGLHHPVVVYSHSCTKFSAVKKIIFEPGKGFHPAPTEISADTQVVTDDITTFRRGLLGRIILRRAWGEVGAQQDEAIAFAKENAQSRIVEAFDEALQERLARLNQAVDVRTLAETLFKVELPPVYQCSTQPGFLQMAVPTKPGEPCDIKLPPLAADARPIQLWLHSSLFGLNVPRSLPIPQELVSALSESLLKPLAAIPTFINSGEKSGDKIEAHAAPPTLTTAGDWVVIQFTGDRLREKAAQLKTGEPSAAATYGKRKTEHL